MAILQGNDAYLEINSRVVGNPADSTEQIFKTCKLTLNTAEQGTTGGSGTEWEDAGPGLSRINLEVTIQCDDARWVADIQAITNSLGTGQVVEIDWGPNGNGSGELRHQQNFLITSIDGPEVGVEKPAYMWQIQGRSAGAPTNNMYNGDTWT